MNGKQFFIGTTRREAFDRAYAAAQLVSESLQEMTIVVWQTKFRELQPWTAILSYRAGGQ